MSVRGWIAHRAVEELPTDGTILLDSGTTKAIADHFPRDRQLTVITNSIAIPSEIDTVALYVLGGGCAPAQRGRRGGSSNALDDVCIDIAFLSGRMAFTVARGMT